MVTDIGQQFSQVCFAVNALHLAIEDIGRLVTFWLRIVGKKRTNDIPQIIINNIVLIKKYRILRCFLAEGKYGLVLSDGALNFKEVLR